MEVERQQERATYRLCRAGFLVLSMALVIATVMQVLSLPVLFLGRRFLPGLMGSAVWHWGGAPIVWGSLVGCYLLFGRWKTPSWQRRTGLLVVMGLVDAVLWFMDHSEELGLRTGDIGHGWLRYGVGRALGWAEFTLMAGVACEVMAHLGVPRAAEAGRSTASLSATGATVWLLLFCLQTDWQSGWPLRTRPGINLNILLLHLGSTLIWTVALIQVTALTIAACRQCAWVLREMDREDRENDPFRSASERDLRFPAGGEGY